MPRKGYPFTCFYGRSRELLILLANHYALNANNYECISIQDISHAIDTIRYLRHRPFTPFSFPAKRPLGCSGDDRSPAGFCLPA